MELQQAKTILEETRKHAILVLAKAGKLAPAKAKQMFNDQIEALGIAIDLMNEKCCVIKEK